MDKEKCLNIAQESLEAIQKQVRYLNDIEELNSDSQRDLVALVEAQVKMLLAIKEFSL